MDEMMRINQAAEKVISVLGHADIGVILGSGLGDYANTIADAVKLPYSEIPGFPVSTVARHSGMRVLGVSCITNMAAGILNQPLCHEEVTETANRVKAQFKRLLDGVIEKMDA